MFYKQLIKTFTKPAFIVMVILGFVLLLDTLIKFYNISYFYKGNYDITSGKVISMEETVCASHLPSMFQYKCNQPIIRFVDSNNNIIDFIPYYLGEDFKGKVGDTIENIYYDKDNPKMAGTEYSLHLLTRLYMKELLLSVIFISPLILNVIYSIYLFRVEKSVGR